MKHRRNEKKSGREGLRIQERVGYCTDCGRPVDCLDGFFNGVILEDGRLRCFPCDEKNKEKDDPM